MIPKVKLELKNKIYIKILIVLLFFNIISYSLNANILNKLDSLKQELINERLNDTLKLKVIYNISFLNNNFDPLEGLYYADMGLDLAKNMNWELGKAKLYEAKGLNFLSLKLFNKSYKNLKIAAIINKQLKDTTVLSNNYSNIGQIYFHKKEYTKAIEYYNKSINIDKIIGYSQGLFVNYSNFIRMYLEEDNFDINKASLYLDSLNGLLIQLDKPIFRLKYLLLKFSLLFEKNNLEEAYDLLKSNYQEVMTLSNSSLKLNYMEGLIESAESLGKSNLALNYNKLYWKYKDSINHIREIQVIKNLENRNNYLMENKKKELENAELKNEQLILIGLIIVIALLIIFIYFILKKSKENLNLNKVLEDKNRQLKDTLKEVKILVQEVTEKNEEIENQNKELKVFNYKLEIAKEELEVLDKNKNTFFNIIAHDLKSPISGFLSLTKMILSEEKDITFKELVKVNSILYESAKGLSNLLDNLLQWARSQTGTISFEPKEIELNNIVQEVLELHSVLAENKNIKFYHAIPEGTLIYADEDQIRSIVQNLFSNAIKYSYDGGTISIKYLEDNEFWKLSIEDFGKGMDDEAQNKLFKIGEISSRLGTNNEIGTGLGLTICFEFVKMHFGKIDFVSELNQGTTFYISIPKDRELINSNGKKSNQKINV